MKSNQAKLNLNPELKGLTQKNLGSKLAKTLLSSLIIQFTFASVMTLPAQGQNRREGRHPNRDRGVIGAIDINSNFNLPSYSYDDYDLERAREKFEREQNQFERAKKATETVRARANEASGREEAVNKKVQQTLKKIESAQQSEKSLKAEIEKMESAMTQDQAKIKDLNKELEQLNTQISSVTSVIEDLNAKLSATTDETEKVKIAKQIEGQAQILEGLSKQLNAKNAELATLTNQQQNRKQNLVQKNRELEKTKAELSSAQTELPGLVTEQQNVRAETQKIMRELEQNEKELEVARRQLTNSRDRVENVRRNIEIAKQVLEREGERDGREDGIREGIELGEQRGYARGRSEGEAAGLALGTQQGKDRDFESGRQTGISKAKVAAEAKAKTDADVNGKADGKDLGTKEGLAAAYRAGREAGLIEGSTNGSDKVAYSEGESKGKQQGLVDAINDAKPEVARGYSIKENEYLNAQLKQETIGDANGTAAAFKGTQGRFSVDGDDRYYNPTPGTLPHPRLEKFYIEMYDYTYRTELTREYNQAYNFKRSEAYNYFHELERQRAFNLAYPESRKAGETKGYNDTYWPHYNSIYEPLYAQIKEQNRRTYFDLNKNDKTQKDLGFKDGNREASFDKGFGDGRRAVYIANIEIEKKKAYDSGVAQAKALYDNNAIIKIESVNLAEVDRDGIFRPSENVLVEIKLKNFGMKPKADLQIAMKNNLGAIVVKSEAVTAGQISAQSNALVYAPLQAFVDAKAVDGANLSTTVSVYSFQNNQSKVFAEQKFNKSVQYPTGVQIVGFDGILVPGVETAVKLSVVNRSNLPQKIDMSHLVDSTKVILDKSETKALVVNIKETKEVILKMTGRPESKFEETVFETSIRQAGLQFAMPIKLGMTLIKRHTPTAESKGLIISSNLARGGGKKLFESEKFDTWDLRVDGAVQSESILNNYKSKAIHIMADAPSTMDASTLAQLKPFIANNGTVIVWGDKLNESEIGLKFLELANLQVSRVAQLNEKVLGTEYMTGLAINARGLATSLKLPSAKTIEAVRSSLGTVVAMTYNNIFSKDTAYIVSAGLSPNDITAQEIQAFMNYLNVAKLNFDRKLDAMASNANGYAPYLFLDIKHEMMAAQASGYYENNFSSSKLKSAIKRFVESKNTKNDQTKAFVKSYPELRTLAAKHGGKSGLVLSKALEGERYGNRKTFKEVYCEHFKKDENYCKSSGGWPIGGD